MKNNFFKTIPVLLAAGLILTGCTNSDEIGGSSDSTINSASVESEASNSSTTSSSSTNNSSAPASENEPKTAKTLRVSFGDDGSEFTLHLYDNDTAAAIVRHVGTADWRLPIYHFDDYENWEVMQYYDIPSRYEIPSNPEKITSEKAGEVYYSEPNRILLFYGDAEVSGEYTKVGYFDFTEEFKSAVENNPVLEGWGNKIVIIEPGN